MCNNIDDIKKDLKDLCNEYLIVLEKLKSKEIITKETFDACSLKKHLFLEE